MSAYPDHFGCVISFLWYLSTVLEAALLLRLRSTRMARPHRAFTVMIGAMLMRDVLLMSIPLRTLAYTIAWECTLPLVLLSQIAAAVECYCAIAALYLKIGRFAVTIFSVALLLAGLISTGKLPFEMPRLALQPITHTLLLLYGSSDGLLCGGLALAIAFLTRFPSPLLRVPTNLVRHSVLLTAYFATYAVASFLPIARANYTDVTRMSIVCLLYSGWCVALKRKGQQHEEWPAIDAQTHSWITERYRRTEALYNQAADLAWKVRGSK